MTINQLIKRLQTVEAQVGKRTNVVVEWETFKHPDVTHNEIKEVDWELIHIDDGDGCMELTKAGVPKEKRTVTIRGFLEALEHTSKKEG